MATHTPIRWMANLLACCVLAALVACGGDDPVPETPTEEAPAEEAPAEEAPAEEAPAEEAPAEEAPAEDGNGELPEALSTYLDTFSAEERAASNPLSGDAGALATGKEEFESTCFPCHGKTGKGDGPAAQAMKIVPADMSDPARGALVTDGERFLIMKHGIPGTAMQPFGAALSDNQIWTILAHVEALRGGPATGDDSSGGDADKDGG